MSQNAEILSPEERFLLDEIALYVYQSRFGQNVVAMVSERAKAIPDERVIEKLLKETYLDKDNSNFWKDKAYQSNIDLRSPKNKDYLKQVLEQMNLEYLYDLYKDC